MIQENVLIMLRALKDLGRYRALVHYLVLLDLRTRYRSSFLGFFWTLLHPILLMIVMWAVFSRVARIQEDNYALFLLSALMVWNFFQQSVERSLNVIVQNGVLIKSTYVPKVVFPIALVISNFVNMLLFLIAYILIALPTSHGVPWTLCLLPIVLTMLLLISSGATLLMSALTVFFRDFVHLTSVILRALFYTTPVLYPPEILGAEFASVLKFNPMYYPVQATRDVLYAGMLPGMIDYGIGFSMAVLIFILGLLVFSRIQDRFIYYL